MPSAAPMLQDARPHSTPMMTSTPNGLIGEDVPSLAKDTDTALMIPPASSICLPGTTMAMATLPRIDKVATVTAAIRTAPG